MFSRYFMIFPATLLPICQSRSHIKVTAAWNSRKLSCIRLIPYFVWLLSTWTGSCKIAIFEHWRVFKRLFYTTLTFTLSRTLFRWAFSNFATIEFFPFASVWMTLILFQGHRGIRNLKLQVVFLNNSVPIKCKLGMIHKNSPKLIFWVCISGR